eukprot:8616987-Pyramimonas_sp.AAC.1
MAEAAPGPRAPAQGSPGAEARKEDAGQVPESLPRPGALAGLCLSDPRRGRGPGGCWGTGGQR